jgi:hypothetical protein
VTSSKPFRRQRRPSTGVVQNKRTNRATPRSKIFASPDGSAVTPANSCYIASVRDVDMSMYSQLLASALDIDLTSDEEPTTSAALSHVLRCRGRLGGSQWSQNGAEARYSTLVDHLAYDAALIKLVRLLGVDCGAEEFDLPEQARTRLERVLTSRGISLDDIGRPARSTERAATEADAL